MSREHQVQEQRNLNRLVPVVGFSKNENNMILKLKKSFPEKEAFEIESVVSEAGELIYEDLASKLRNEEDSWSLVGTKKGKKVANGGQKPSAKPEKPPMIRNEGKQKKRASVREKSSRGGRNRQTKKKRVFNNLKPKQDMESKKVSPKQIKPVEKEDEISKNGTSHIEQVESTTTANSQLRSCETKSNRHGRPRQNRKKRVEKGKEAAMVQQDDKKAIEGNVGEESKNTHTSSRKSIKRSNRRGQNRRSFVSGTSTRDSPPVWKKKEHVQKSPKKQKDAEEVLVNLDSVRISKSEKPVEEERVAKTNPNPEIPDSKEGLKHQEGADFSEKEIMHTFKMRYESEESKEAQVMDDSIEEEKEEDEEHADEQQQGAVSGNLAQNFIVANPQAGNPTQPVQFVTLPMVNQSPQQQPQIQGHIQQPQLYQHTGSGEQYQVPVVLPEQYYTVGYIQPGGMGQIPANPVVYTQQPVQGTQNGGNDDDDGKEQIVAMQNYFQPTPYPVFPSPSNRRGEYSRNTSTQSQPMQFVMGPPQYMYNAPVFVPAGYFQPPVNPAQETFDKNESEPVP